MKKFNLTVVIVAIFAGVGCAHAESFTCTGILTGVINPNNNNHFWTVEDMSGKYKCAVPTGQSFSSSTGKCKEGSMCQFVFSRYRQDIGNILLILETPKFLEVWDTNCILSDGATYCASEVTNGCVQDNSVKICGSQTVFTEKSAFGVCIIREKTNDLKCGPEVLVSETYAKHPESDKDFLCIRLDGSVWKEEGLWDVSEEGDVPTDPQARFSEPTLWPME